MSLSSMRFGQYVRVTHHHTRTLKDGRVFTTIVYCAYSAGGCVGTEMNGLAALQEKPKRRVVLDGVCPQPSGWNGPSKEQVALFEQVQQMDDGAFIDWCNGSPRLREPLLGLGEKLRRPKPRKMASFADGGVYGPNKEAFHRAGRAALRRLAKALELPPGSFEVRSNKGGIAVSGEVVLHGESIYVMVSHSFSGLRIMFRRCHGRKDYTGVTNHYAPIGLLDDPEELVKHIRARINLKEGA